MAPPPTDPPPSVALASAPAGAATTAPRLLGIVPPAWLRLPRLGLAQRPLAAKLALATTITGTFAIVAYATSSQNVLVPHGYFAFPPWFSGPLHYIFRSLPINQRAIDIGFSFIVLSLLCAWGVLIIAVRQLSLRTILLAVLALHAIVVFSPPLQLTDVFNYIGYARLGALHHLSPYTHVIKDELHDPVFRFSSWHNLHSPYGPLFTALTYPLGFLPLAYAYWIVKITTMLASLGLIALVHHCARQLGRDPRYAIVLLATNPIYVVYAMGGFHNDFFMLLPMLGAVSLLLSRRDRSAGAVLMLAVAIKFSAVLLLPFLLLAARPSRRRREIVVGAVLGGLPLAGLSLALFGPHLPNLSDQSTLLTPFSIPNLTGLLIGADGGAPWLLRAATLALVVLVLWLLYRRRDWISSAGWATVGLIASLPWLMPWYVIWVLPLAALGMSLRLRRAAVVLSTFLVITFMPVTGWEVNKHGLNPMNTKVGHASYRLQKTLAN
jgi:alpha-1,6-mannosyltransferase